LEASRHGQPCLSEAKNKKGGKEMDAQLMSSVKAHGGPARSPRADRREVKAGGIVVIPADTPHRFVNSGDTLLRQIDNHASPRFIQTNLS
jgi:hypothetical protein